MAECSCCVRVTCRKLVTLGSVPQQPQFHGLLEACARPAPRRGDVGIAIMVYLGRRASGGHIGGCIVDLDDMIVSDTIEVLHPLTNHDRVLTLRSAADHPFRDWYVQKSYPRD
jgi:hypothetical protein